MISIYNYSNPVSYLKDYFSFRKNTDGGFSLNKWAKTVGMNSPKAIMEILNEGKPLRVSFANSILAHVGLDSSEYGYFLALTSKALSQNEELSRMYDLLLNDLRPDKKESYSEARFNDGSLFSHWILTTILGVSRLKNIQMSSAYIKDILREEISEEIIDSGISYLLAEGLLKEENGKFVRTFDRVSTKSDVKHDAVSNYFFQMSDLAKKAVDVELEKREFQSFNMPISSDKIALAKDIIRKCRNQLSSLCTDNADEVYQMNMFLFPLTKAENPYFECENL